MRAPSQPFHFFDLNYFDLFFVIPNLTCVVFQSFLRRLLVSLQSLSDFSKACGMRDLKRHRYVCFLLSSEDAEIMRLTIRLHP